MRHRRTPFLILLLAALAACSSATAPADAGVSGTWRGAYYPTACPADSVTNVVLLSASADTLTGTYQLTDCNGTLSTGAIDNASVSGDNVSFDSGWNVFTGVVTGNQMSGELTPQGIAITLTRE